MLKELAPKAKTPPSPKKRAWMAKATEAAITAAQGPKMMATKTLPTAWPVVPPGRGTLNIMMTKEKAAKRAMRGTIFAVKTPFTFWLARYQKGAVATYIAAQLAGLR
jgi:hypothetical protein